jgi:hypothetical protein
MPPKDPTAAASRRVLSNADDKDMGHIFFARPEGVTSPVTIWLSSFVEGDDPEAIVAGMADGRLEPVLSPGVVRAAMAGCGVVETPPGRRTWSYMDAILTTPHPLVHVGVILDATPGDRFMVGIDRGEDGAVLHRRMVAAAVRATMSRLRAAVTTIRVMPVAPVLRPFRTKEGMRSFSQIAARKDLAIDHEASLAVDRLQEASNAESKAMHEAMAAGTLDHETALERMEVGKRAWLVEANRLVGADTVLALLGADAKPSREPPEAPGWPYWLRSTAALGRDLAKGNGSFELMQSIQFLCRYGGHSAIDAAYRRIDVDAVSDLALITLLRTPFTQRDRLAEWTGFRERVRAALFARGLDADKVLVGLGKDDAGGAGGAGGAGTRSLTLVD